MSYNEEMMEKKKRASGPRPAAKEPKKSSSSRLVSYSPTKEDKEAIKAENVGLEEILDFLSTYLQDGHKLSFQYHGQTQSYFWLLREGGVEWTQAAALSAWHMDYLRAGQMLYHALHHRYKDFPVLGLLSEALDLEW